MNFSAAFAIPRKLLPIMGMVFVITLGWGMAVPILPLIAERVGGTTTDSGVLLASFAIARLAMGVPAGAASDRFGRRALMLAGIVLFTIGSFGAVAAGSVVTVALALFIVGSGSACYVAAALAAVADLSDGGGRGRLMSYYQSGVLAGVSVGPAMGGLLVSYFDIHAPFLVQGVVAAAGGIIATLALKETHVVRTGGSDQPSGLVARLRLLASPAMLSVCTLAFALYASRVVATWQVVPILARVDFGYDSAMVGAMLTAGALANLCALPIASLSIENYGARASIIWAGLAVLVGLCLMCLPAGPLAMWTSVLLLGAAGSTIATGCAAYAAESSEVPHGLTMGTLRMSGDLGLVVGPLVLAAIIGGFGAAERTGIAVIAVFMALVLGGFILASRRIDPPVHL